MTTTILAAIALTGSLVTSAKPEFQVQTDYGQAMRKAASEGKPMAVLIGKGDTFAKLFADSGMPDATAKLLREKYVCLNVDVDTAKGAELAKQFQLTDGLVISSAGGSHQAFRHAGTVNAADVAKHATTYANVSSTPVTTVTAGEVVYSSAPATTGTVIYSNCAGGTCSTPVYSTIPSGTTISGNVIYSNCAGGSCPTPVYYPSNGYRTTTGTVIPAGYSLPSYGSSCPNGRCPTPR
jgi:hypothetical protein